MAIKWGQGGIRVPYLTGLLLDRVAVKGIIVMAEALDSGDYVQVERRESGMSKTEAVPITQLLGDFNVPTGVGDYKIVGGATALDGSNPTPITTGLTTVVGFAAVLQGSSAPAVGTSILTHTISGGTVSVYAWKPTSNSDPTLIASTGTETVSWVAIGT